MSVCISVKVSEGLVLAADSASAVQGEFTGPSGKGSTGILKTYEHVRKLSHIKDYPIGTLSWGTALVGARSVESLVKEFEYSIPSLEEEQAKIDAQRKEGRAKRSSRPKYDVKKIASDLLAHVKGFYDEQYSTKPENERSPLGILVSGFSSGKFFPVQWLMELPLSSEVKPVRPDKNGKPNFGANWFGLTDAIERLHWGRDGAALNLLSKRFDINADEVHEILKPLQYPVLFDGMPLQDAIDYAVYLVNVVIGRFRFVLGAPLCGGEIDVAVITPNEFTWVQRKSWRTSLLAQSKVVERGGNRDIR